jgi:hypothetical protein
MKIENEYGTFLHGMKIISKIMIIAFFGIDDNYLKKIILL